MHTIRLDIQDSIFNKVISFLSTLPKNKVVITENTTLDQTTTDDNSDSNETLAFSNHTANLIEEWQDTQEDEIWK